MADQPPGTIGRTASRCAGAPPGRRRGGVHPRRRTPTIPPGRDHHDQAVRREDALGPSGPSNRPDEQVAEPGVLDGPDGMDAGIARQPSHHEHAASRARPGPRSRPGGDRDRRARQRRITPPRRSGRRSERRRGPRRSEQTVMQRRLMPRQRSSRRYASVSSRSATPWRMGHKVRGPGTLALHPDAQGCRVLGMKVEFFARANRRVRSPQKSISPRRQALGVSRPANPRRPLPTFLHTASVGVQFSKIGLCQDPTSLKFQFGKILGDVVPGIRRRGYSAPPGAGGTPSSKSRRAFGSRLNLHTAVVVLDPRSMRTRLARALCALQPRARSRRCRPRTAFHRWRGCPAPAASTATRLPISEARNFR